MVAALIAKHAISITFSFLTMCPRSGITGESCFQRPIMPGTYQKDSAVEYQLFSAHVCSTFILSPLSDLMIAPQYSTLVFEILLLALAVRYFVSNVLQTRRLLGPEMLKMHDLVQILVRDSLIYLRCMSKQTNRLMTLILIRAFKQYDIGCVGYHLENVRKHPTIVHNSQMFTPI